MKSPFADPDLRTGGMIRERAGIGKPDVDRTVVTIPARNRARTVARAA